MITNLRGDLRFELCNLPECRRTPRRRRTPWWRTAAWRPARRSAGSRASPLHSNVTLRDITWHDVTHVRWPHHNKPRHDTFSWMFAFGRRIVGGNTTEWRPVVGTGLAAGDWRCIVWTDTSALTRAPINLLGMLKSRHNFVDFRWQSMWHCQVVQCFSVAQIKSPSPGSPVYGWGLRVQTIYTHRQLRLDFLFS